MAVELAAPYPAIQTITMLPNPELSDSEALTGTVTSLRAVDGTLYTYVKRTNERRKLVWSFTLSRPKALELRAFLLSYYAALIRVTDHNNRVWTGYFINNPFEFVTDRRGAPSWQGLPGESQSITLEFEGVESA
jgi:hypothetical protein